MRVSFNSFEALAAHFVGREVEEVVQDIVSARQYAKWNREDRKRSSMNAFIARNDAADEHLEKDFRASGDARLWREKSCHVNRNRKDKVK
jgi:hypothetical protein